MLRYGTAGLDAEDRRLTVAIIDHGEVVEVETIVQLYSRGDWPAAAVRTRGSRC